jgi:hypothetical protein
MNQLDFTPEKEKDLSGHTKAISKEEFEKLREFVRKRICKIKCSDGKHGTGFFCIIFLDNGRYFTTLITNNHILKAENIIPGKKIKLSLNDEDKNYEIEIDKGRRTYTSIKYDITIIELKNKDHLNNVSFFVIDEKIYEPNYKYKDISIVLLHYSKGKKSKVSPGTIKNIFEGEESYKIQHLCESDEGSSGGPLINSMNGKVFGIHKGVAKGDQKYNEGILLKEPIIEFENMIKKELENNNKAKIIEKNNIENIDTIIIKYKIEDCSKDIRIFGDKFVENNRYKCKIIINKREFELKSHINAKNIKLNNGILEI